MSSTIEYWWIKRKRDKYYTVDFVRKRVLKSFREERYHQMKVVFFVNLEGLTKSSWNNLWSFWFWSIFASFLVTAFTSKLNTIYRMTRSELIGNGWNGRRWRNAMCGSPRLVCCQPPDMTCHIPTPPLHPLLSRFVVKALSTFARLDFLGAESHYLLTVGTRAETPTNFLIFLAYGYPPSKSFPNPYLQCLHRWDTVIFMEDSKPADLID